MAKLVTLRTFLDQQEALIAQGLLERNGIPAFANDLNFTAVSWMHLFAIGGIRLKIMDTDLENARAVLDLPPDSLISGGVDHCPDCGSGEVMRRASVIVAAVFFFWMQIPYCQQTRGRYCRSCGHKWRLQAD